ncbi:Short-chain dehydrogenase/reductase family protein [Mycena kentingensis (nom. inval.)]|nr:Short-chain dehydrogenase/reductase family protein [Mycena kentingensis (nom. inval.)]
MSLLPAFSFSTTSDEVVAALSKEISGKTVLVTGTSLNGIGYDTARAIAKYASLVIVTGYNPERLKLSATSLRAENPDGAEIRPLILDLCSLASVRDAAAVVNAYSEPLHVLVNNAADGSGLLRVTEDGFDAQMSTDYLGPWLFTKLLLPKLLAAGTSDWLPRVVCLSSGAHTYTPGIDLAHLRRPVEGTTFLERYGETKAANVLFALELARRGAGKVLAYSLHPGIIFTNMHTKEALLPAMKAIRMFSLWV